MNKKGTHVDWAISIGIFLLYLVGLFILLRPGVTPVHKPDTLLNIIEDRINEEIMWEVKEVPIILDRDCGGGSLWDECSGQNVEHPRIFIDIVKDWRLSSKLKPEGKAKLDGSVLTDLKDKTIPKGTYFITLYPKNEQKKELKVSISDASPCQCHIDKQGNARTSLGASTFKEGINNDRLTTLKNKFSSETDYNTIKSAWGFPDEKEFQILIDNDPLPGFMADNEPYAQANVFAKQIKSWILNKDGSLDPPVEIIIKVW